MSKQQNPRQKQEQIEALAAKLAAAEPEVMPTGTPFYESFDAYVQDHPDGERHRAWLTSNNRNAVSLVLMRGAATHNSLPGGYLALTLNEYTRPNGSPYLQLSLRDDDDGVAIRTWPVEERAGAESVVANMKLLAPFSMREAVDVFGLRFD